LSCVDIVGYSNANIDIVLKVDKIPDYDDKIKGKLIGKFPGGTMANYSCATSVLGLNSAWTGSLGKDSMGRLLVNDFNDYKVNIDTAQIRNDIETMFSVIMIDDKGERSIIVVPTFSEPKYLTSQQKKLIAEAKILYTAPYKEINFYNIAKYAKNNNTLVAVDIELTSNIKTSNIDKIVKMSDIVIFNQSVLSNLYDIKFRKDARFVRTKKILKQFISEENVLIIGVTMGKQGSILINKESSYYFKSFDINPLDTTGAGDCYNAALTFGLMQSWKLKKIGLFANAAGALASTEIGSRGYLPDFNTIERFINNCKTEKQVMEI